MSEQMLTACRDCAHFRRIGGFEVWGRICIASPIMHFDAYTGIRKQAGYETIYKVNVSGDCPKFQRKEGE
jgi:hypothetical protein